MPGSPVEARVAAIFRAISPDFPIPGDDDLSRAAISRSTAFPNRSSSSFPKPLDRRGLHGEDPAGALDAVIFATFASSPAAARIARERPQERLHVGQGQAVRPVGQRAVGSGWISRKRPSTPPPRPPAPGGHVLPLAGGALPAPPGSCTLWVASKITGQIPTRGSPGTPGSRPPGCCTRRWFPAPSPGRFRCPWRQTFSTAFRMSHGAMNCPFLMFTATPVSPPRRAGRSDGTGTPGSGAGRPGGDGAGLPGFVDIGGDGKAVPAPEPSRGCAAPRPRPARGTGRPVEERFALSDDPLEHHVDGEPGGEIREEGGDGQGDAPSGLEGRTAPAMSRQRASGADPEPVRDGDPTDHALSRPD